MSLLALLSVLTLLPIFMGDTLQVRVRVRVRVRVTLPPIFMGDTLQVFAPPSPPLTPSPLP